MKKQSINQPLYTEELDPIQLDQTEEELRKLIEEDLVPSTSEFQKYNQMIPNGADRILKIIEEDRLHRRKMDKRKQEGRYITKILSIIFGFGLTSVMVLSAMTDGITRFEFMLLWVITLVILGLIFATFIKENLVSNRQERD